MNEIEAFIREASKLRGIGGDTAIKVARSEGGIVTPAKRGTFATGSSWWPFQLHYGGKGYEHLGTDAGQGNGFTALTGWQPGDPRAWRDSVRYALNRAKANGWGDWYGAKAQGIVGFKDIDVVHYWDAHAETWDYETGGGSVPALPFNPDARVDLQPDDWSCSVQSAEFLLRSIGRTPDDQWIQNQLLGAGIVTREHGLMDASGQQLADWINREYGAEMGFTAQASPVVFEDVYAGAGVNPMMIGGRGWNHWVGVRRAANGDLALANPSPGFKGVGDTISRAQFAAQGPFTCVWIDRMSAAPPGTPPAPVFDRAAVVAGLRALLARHDAYDRAVRADLARLLAMTEAA